MLLLLTRIPAVSRVVSHPGSPALLALPHSVRIMGWVFLLVWALGGLPAIFALPAAAGDIAIGVAAPFVARRLAEGRGRRGAIWFNAMGLFDFAVAFAFGLTAGVGQLQVFDVSPTTGLLRLLPLALIPTVLVPIAAALHIVSLRRLAAQGTALPAPSAALRTS